MYTVTYDLKKSELVSDAFYRDLELYSRLVFQEIDDLLYDGLVGFFRFRRHEGVELLYSYKEGYLELLTLGVLWMVYSGDAVVTNEETNDLLLKMAELRDSNKHLKPIVDAFRGICLTFLMSPDLYDHMGVATPNTKNLTALLDWLEATNEFKYEVKRLRHWERYLNQLPDRQSVELLEQIISTGIWFEKNSIDVLGIYTEQVDRYLNEIRPKKYWKEDVIFCGRRRVEYHLNMLAASWLNDAYRKAFIEKEKRIVLVPTCLRMSGSESCQAEKRGEWLICAHCHPNCEVNSLSQLESEYQFNLYMVEHNSSIEQAPKDLDLQSTGVIGAACVLNLISGGWMLAEYGIPAQCIILDYSGCKNHWHHEGIPTSLNMKQFKHILNRG